MSATEGNLVAVRSGLGMAMLPDPMIEADPQLTAASPTISYRLIFLACV